jgi:flagellar motility protein MotE (MotC chaperone)
MKRLIQSPLFAGLLAVVLFFGIQAYLIVGVFSPHHETRSPRTAEIEPGEVARFYWDFWTPEIDAFVEDLRSQRQAIDERKAELASLEARLEAESLELERTRQGLVALRTDLENRIVEVGLTEEKNLKTLAQTYSNMAPESALMILREMEDDVVVKVLMHMKPDVVGAIMEEMTRASDDNGLLVKRAAVLSNRLRLARRESADTNT